MNVLRYLLLWAVSFIFTSVFDALWHLVIFKKSYVEGMKPLARRSGAKMSFKAGPGLLSQVLVVTSLVVLVLIAARGGTALPAVIVGALAGVLAISVYGVTNYALFKDWNLTLTVLEFIWGPLLGGISGLFVFWAKSFLLK